MSVDISAARGFMAENARPLDRLRFRMALGEAVEPGMMIAALNAYAVTGGGYGNGLEPDLRGPEAQPAAAMRAFEVLDEIAPASDAGAGSLCAWLAGIMLPDGGLPFALPVADQAACAPVWVAADHCVSSLRMTAAVAGAAHRLARTDPRVATHPWLMMATGFCLRRMEDASGPMPAHELMFSLRLLAAMEPLFPRAAAQLDRLGSQIPRSGRVPVAGGAQGEFVRPLDLAPYPGDAVRDLIPRARVDDDLERLAGGQAGDGGWISDRAFWSSDAAREWRGCLTVRAVRILRANGVLG
jgi:hypothetical protein